MLGRAASDAIAWGAKRIGRLAPFLWDDAALIDSKGSKSGLNPAGILYVDCLTDGQDMIAEM